MQFFVSFLVWHPPRLKREKKGHKPTSSVDMWLIFSHFHEDVLCYSTLVSLPLGSMGMRLWSFYFVSHLALKVRKKISHKATRSVALWLIFLTFLRVSLRYSTLVSLPLGSMVCDCDVRRVHLFVFSIILFSVTSFLIK